MPADLLTDLSRATDANGNTLSGAQWFFYTTGTTTPQPVYTNATLSVAHTNPVVADAGGEFPAIYFDSNLVYRGILKTASGVTIKDRDPINPRGGFLASRGRDILVTDFPWLADPTGETDSTSRIQAAIDYLFTQFGGGTVSFPDGAYRISASTLDETYDNNGAPVPASACGLVQRAGVSLAGLGRRTARIFTDDRTLIIIAQVAPVNCEISRLEICSNWVTGLSGAGHGIFTLGTEGGADISCRSNLYSDLLIRNVASYCIGLQNGNPTRCTIENIDTFMNGADCFDLKARGADGIEPSANVITDITIRGHGARVTGSAGIDVRGVWHVSNVTVTDFGGNAALDYVGVRLRTKPPIEDDYQLAGARSTVNGVYVRPTIGAAGLTIIGVQVGSDDTSISNVVTEDCHYGFSATGNLNGVPIGCTVTGFHSLNSRIYGFFIGSGCQDITLIGCHSQNSATAGIRDAGVRTKIIGHDVTTETTPISTTVGALPTQIVIGGALGFELGLTTTSAAAGRVSISPVGASTDIDIGLNPKGAGLVRMGTYTATGDAAINGYITIKSSSGATIKLATVA